MRGLPSLPPSLRSPPFLEQYDGTSRGGVEWGWGGWGGGGERMGESKGVREAGGRRDEGAWGREARAISGAAEMAPRRACRIPCVPCAPHRQRSAPVSSAPVRLHQSPIRVGPAEHRLSTAAPHVSTTLASRAPPIHCGAPRVYHTGHSPREPSPLPL